MAAPVSNPWLRLFEPRPLARLRLFCFPYAGGGASIFRSWGSGLPATVEVCALQLPGRETRFRDPAFRQLEPLADEIARVLQSELQRPFAFFGHSMGAALAFEVARRLARAGGPTPVHLLVSGRNAPREPDEDPPIYGLPRDQFFAELKQHGGTPDEVLANAELMELVEPLLRADFELIETYDYQADGTLLTMPLTAFTGLEDADVPLAKVLPWAEETTGPFRSHALPGGHFFLNGHRAELLALVGRALAPHLL
jgi:medium-chain acyl-[acyl-carrier-protein] hydrolase